MRFVRVNGHYVYMHKGNRLETIEPGSVVSMDDDTAEAYILREMGIEADGPERLIRPGPDPPPVERPGSHPGPAKAESAVARPQKH